jgi:hypothetical protein
VKRRCTGPRLATCLILVLVFSERATADPSKSRPRDFTASSTIALHDGANDVDILGDGHPAQIFVAWRENYNAHGFSSVAFYLKATDPGSRRSTDATWLLLPFFGGPDDPEGGRNVTSTVEGADCTLRDLRIVRRRRRSVQVVIGTRALGQSFADTAPIEFTFYEIRRNSEGVPGWPGYYFQSTRTIRAGQEYCDVNEAFARELGLGAKGLGHGEGGR